MGLLGFDSLDALRASLTAQLGRESLGQESGGDIGPVIARLLLDESRANERHIGALRASLATVYFGLAAASALSGSTSLSRGVLVAAFLWAALAIVTWLALRRDWYPLWLRRAGPVADAVAIVAGSALARGGAEMPEGLHVAVAANASLLCAFLTYTGALRMTKVSARFSSGLALVAFLIVAISARIAVLPTIGIMVGLLASSALAARLTDGIRRVLSTELDRLTMERLMGRANAQAAEARVASAAREEVLRIVAHDLRNPLGTLLMSADVLGEPALTDELRARQAAVVKRTGARMNRMIQDLLNVARMDTAGLSVEPTQVAPAVLIANAMELMQPLAAERSLALVTDVANGLPDVHADVERIGQVFSNLIGNAIKFTPAGGTITLSAALADGRVWFSVTDTGPGIPPEQLARVFGPFWQARKADDRGIGLGLTIAKGIVEAHHGTIGVDSEVGVGTRFFFSVSAATSST